MVLWGMRDPALIGTEPLWTPGQGPSQVLRGTPDRTYLMTLPVFLAGAALNLLLPGQLALNPFDRVMLPLLLIVLLALVVLSERGRLPRQALHLLLLLEGWAYLLGKLLFLLLNLPAAGQLAALTPLVPWVPVLLASHAWVLPRALAHRFTLVGLSGLAFLTLLFALHGPGLEPAMLSDSPLSNSPLPAAPLPVLLQVLLAGLVLLAGQGQVKRSVARRMSRSAWQALPDQARDPLTGLPDTAAMRRALQVLVSQAAGQTDGLAVAVMRPRGLEQLRAEQGEARATHLLAHLGRVLVEAVRDGDVVGRYGPEGFMLLLGVPDERAGRAACERLRLHVGTRPIDGVVPAVRVGVAFAGGPQCPQALLECAVKMLEDTEAGGGSPAQLPSAPEPQAG